MPRVPPPPAPPRPEIVIVIPNPQPDPDPVTPGEEAPPVGNCEIIGLYWYAPGMSGNFEEAQNAYAERSGSDPDYEWTPRDVFAETAPEAIWIQEIGFCDNQPWAVQAVLRGYCEAMGPTLWVPSWSNTDDNPGWYPDLIMTPAGTAVVIFTAGAPSGVEDGGELALSVIVNGITYGPITLVTKDCG